MPRPPGDPVSDASAPEALDGLGRAMWWLGDPRAGVERRREAYALFRRRGETGKSPIFSLSVRKPEGHEPRDPEGVVRVSLVTDHFSHHAEHSGYARVAHPLAERIDVAWVRPARLPRPIAARYVARVRRRTLGAHRLDIEMRNLAIEVAAAARLHLRPSEPCHLLYGDGMLRYLTRMRRSRHRRCGPLVATFHQPPDRMDSAARSRERPWRGLDAAVALSRPQESYLVSELGRERVFLSAHGVDTTFFRPGGAPRESSLFLCVGHWLRDYETLEAVVRAVLAEDAQAHFRIVGSKGLPPSLSRYPRVSVLGGLTDGELLESYRQSTAVVLPLLDATANNALLEALACGAPVVVSDVGGVRDYVDDRCAILTPRGDDRAMSRALLALAADEGRREELGRRARSRSLELDFRLAAERLVDIYTALG